MNTKYSYLLSLTLLLLSMCFYNSCTDYDVKGDTSFYDNVTIKVSEMKDDTLFVNFFNEQQISIETNTEGLVFDMKAFIYNVADTNVLKLDASGNILPVSLGTTDVSMIFRANPKVTTQCKICIWRDSVYIEKIIAPDINMKLGKTYDLISAMIIVPENADNKKMVFEVLTPSVISVDDKGVITALTEGEGQIKISSADGRAVSTTCTVKVIAEIKVSDIRIPAGFDGKTIGIGQTIDLGSKIVVLPANADNMELDYTVVSGTDVVSVTATGVIKTVGLGSAVIRISSTDDSGIFKEITLNVNDSPLLDRGFWSVTTQTATDYGYIKDGTTGLPEHMFDDSGSTFLSLSKPGKNAGGVLQPLDFIPSFTVDMQSQQIFNYFTWRHRSSNNYNRLRVYAVNIEGSNNGESFTLINTAGLAWIPNTAGYVGSVSVADNNTYNIDIPESTYRYIRVKLEMWSDIYDGQYPGSPGKGSTEGGALQISEFGLGKR